MTMDDFFVRVCEELGLKPTSWRLAVFGFWASRESPGQLFTKARNPLATTYDNTTYVKFDLSYNNGNGPGNWNSVPVKVYATYEDGIIATARTLKLSHYENIRRCFRDQRGYQEAVQDFMTWIGPDAQYGQRVVDFMNSLELKWKNWPLTDEQMRLVTGEFAATSPNPPWSPNKPHMGVDFGISTGTSVRAPAGGRIVVPTNDGSFGVAVCIQHDTEPPWFSLFAHLSRSLVKAGDRVEAGRLLGYSGATGQVSGAHLHWQLCSTSTFPRDLSLNRDPLAVPFISEGDNEMGMTPEEKQLVDNIANKVARLESIVAVNGIDTDGDGIVDKTGEEAIAWAYQRGWSAFYGISLARQQIANHEASGQMQVTQVVDEIARRLVDS